MVARSKAVVRVGVGVTISPVIWNPANGWPLRTRVRRLTQARRRAVVAAVTRKVRT